MQSRSWNYSCHLHDSPYWDSNYLYISSTTCRNQNSEPKGPKTLWCTGVSYTWMKMTRAQVLEISIYFYVKTRRVLWSRIQLNQNWIEGRKPKVKIDLLKSLVAPYDKLKKQAFHPVIYKEKMVHVFRYVNVRAQHCRYYHNNLNLYLGVV